MRQPRRDAERHRRHRNRMSRKGVMASPATPDWPAQTERPRSPSKTATSTHRRAYEIVALLPTGADAARSRLQPVTVRIAALIRREIRSIGACGPDHGRRRIVEKISDV